MSKIAVEKYFFHDFLVLLVVYYKAYIRLYLIEKYVFN